MKPAVKTIDIVSLFRRLTSAGLFFLLIAFCQSGQCEDSVKIKILAINPSATHNLKTTISQYLPPEVGPDDVLDKEGIAITYDAEKRSYLIQKEVDLKPSEAQTIEIRIRNVWVITPEQIDEVKSQLKQSVGALAKTKFAATGKLLFEKASEAIAQIEENQSKSLGIMQKIDLYRLNIKQLEDLKQNALSLEAMRKLEHEKKSEVREVKFIVSAENPSAQERRLTVRRELPRDIEATDVLDKGEFSFVLDNRKLLVEREDTLGPHEVKRYEISIRDVWYIPQSELDFLKSEVEKLAPLFDKSPYEDFVSKQKEFVFRTIHSITALQEEVSSSDNFDDRIRAYVLNEQREKSAKRKIKELQDLLSEVTLKSRESEDQDKPRKWIKKLLDIKYKIFVSLGNQSKKTIFWWFFLGVILFLAGITIILYGTWLKKLQENKWAQPGKIVPKAESKDTPPSNESHD